jgi:hypothetical protein
MSYGKTLCQQRCHLSCWVKVGNWPEEDGMFAFYSGLARLMLHGVLSLQQYGNS